MNNIDVEERANLFLSEYVLCPTNYRDGLKDEGQKIAQMLHREAIGFCMNKATEFSPKIEQYFLLSAKIAYLIYGAQSPQLAVYEKNVYYYKNFDPPSWIVKDYDNFKQSHKENEF